MDRKKAESSSIASPWSHRSMLTWHLITLGECPKALIILVSPPSMVPRHFESRLRPLRLLVKAELHTQELGVRVKLKQPSLALSQSHEFKPGHLPSRLSPFHFTGVSLLPESTSVDPLDSNRLKPKRTFLSAAAQYPYCNDVPEPKLKEWENNSSKKK